MKVEFYCIDELTTERVAFYSVLLGENEEKPNEYREFEARMNINDANRFDLAELKQFIINKIGVDGAIDKHFKYEGTWAERIKQPTPDEFFENIDVNDPKDYGLRLYCLRLSREVVVLFNGDRKWYSNPTKCPSCSVYFKRANVIAKAIKEAINLKEVSADGFDIVYENDDYYITI